MSDLRGKTTSGFEFVIPEENLDDYELLELFCRFDEGDPVAMISIPGRLLGDAQKEKLKEHIRKENNGRVSTTQMFIEITEIMQVNKETKNS